MRRVLERIRGAWDCVIAVLLLGLLQLGQLLCGDDEFDP